MVGTTTWNSGAGDWDMADHELAPETGSCKPHYGFIWNPVPHDPESQKRSCWHHLWDVPVGTLKDVGTLAAGAAIVALIPVAFYLAFLAAI